MVLFPPLDPFLYPFSPSFFSLSPCVSCRDLLLHVFSPPFLFVVVVVAQTLLKNGGGLIKLCNYIPFQ